MHRRVIVVVLVSLGLAGCPGPRGSVSPATTPEPPASAPMDDADGDGVRGTLDDCPDAPEDVDDDLDHDGCPDVDRGPRTIAEACPSDADHDAIADAIDGCPADAETYDAREDDDGCPDAATPIVVRAGAELVVDPPIAFDFDSSDFRPPSEPLLDALASYLAHHREISRLEIQGHLGEEHYGGQQLDRDRARAVADALVARGVARERLEPVAYGFTRPLPGTDARQPERRNWRIVLAILEEVPCLEPESASD